MIEIIPWISFIALVLVMLAIDLYADLPLFWTIAEGPPIMALGLVILVLVRSVGPD